MQTAVFKFYKNLEKYALIKDSQFILNIPLELLREILEQANKNDETKSEIPNLSEIPTPSQTEISDEEIEKGAKEWYGKKGLLRPYQIEKMAWISAIKWYREQLKKKQ